MQLHLDAATGDAVEKWYLRRGLTFLLQGTHLRSSWSQRATAPLIVMFVLAMLFGAPSLLTLSPAAALSICIAALLLAWVGANLVRRRRAFAKVQKIGWIEAAVFVLVPTAVVGLTPASQTLSDLIPLSTFEERLLLASIMMMWQLSVLAIVVFLVTSGVVPLTLFVSREVAKATSGSFNALAAALPVLLSVVFFFYFNAGVWAVIATVDRWAYVTLILLFALLGGTFLGSRAQLDLDALAHFDTAEELHEALVNTPLAGEDVTLAQPADAQLTNRHKANLRVVAVLSRLASAAMLASAVFLAFLVLGFLTIGPDIIKGWTKVAPHEIFGMTTNGTHRHMLSWEHLKVAGFLATFSGFNFALVSASDARLREAVNDSAGDLVREASAVRLALLGPRADDAEAEMSAPEAPTDANRPTDG